MHVDFRSVERATRLYKAPPEPHGGLVVGLCRVVNVTDLFKSNSVEVGAGSKLGKSHLLQVIRREIVHETGGTYVGRVVYRGNCHERQGFGVLPGSFAGKKV